MKFDDLDKKMRVFETASDQCVIPSMYMVARIDGRSFTKLTKETHNFERPFSIVFRDLMVETTKHLLNSDFNLIYGYTQSDEISLLFSINESLFGRKLRKLNSILAGEASAKFSLLLNDLGVFDCRISQLPSRDLVVNYFRWRHEDAFKNALGAHSYWKLRDNGMTVKEATKQLHGTSVAQKNELLFQNGINFNTLPNWQKRGIGIYWETYLKIGVNPMNNQPINSFRRSLKVDYDLPIKDAYSQFVEDILHENNNGVND